MAARDRYDVNVNCPKCGEKGMLQVSENDYPFMRRLDKTVDSMDGNFSAKINGDSDISLVCGNCSEKFTA